MKLLNAVEMYLEYSPRLVHRIKFLVRQNPRISKFILSSYLFDLPTALAVVNALPPTLKTLSISFWDTGSAELTNLQFTTVIQEIRTKFSDLEELEIKFLNFWKSGLYPHEISCESVEQLSNWQSLRRICLESLGSPDEISQPLASRIIGNKTTLFTECLKEVPFNEAKALKLLGHGSDPNVLLPSGARPFLYCATKEALSFLIQNTDFDPALPCANGINSVVAAAFFLPSSVLQAFLFADSIVEKQFKSKSAAKFFDPSSLLKEYNDVLNWLQPQPRPLLFPDRNLDVLLSQEFTSTYGSCIEARCPSTGDSLLHLACKSGVSVESLLDAGIAIAHRNVQDRLAVEYSHMDLPKRDIERLLEGSQGEQVDFFFTRPQLRGPSPKTKSITLFEVCCRKEIFSAVREVLSNCTADQAIQALFNNPDPQLSPKMVLTSLVQYEEGLTLLYDCVLSRGWAAYSFMWETDPECIRLIIRGCHQMKRMDILKAASHTCGMPLHFEHAVRAAKLIDQEFLKDLLTLCKIGPLQHRRYLDSGAVYDFNDLLLDGSLEKVECLLSFLKTNDAPQELWKIVIGGKFHENTLQQVVSGYRSVEISGATKRVSLTDHECFHFVASLILEAHTKYAIYSFDVLNRAKISLINSIQLSVQPRFSLFESQTLAQLSNIIQGNNYQARN